ncbi:hypothetical protein PVOR_01600 [Paenibacillus vortex V453]|uniref:Uncharacterized protein n=1 Tax=Paenibacillus vortex V453 TaxID=715225 RepID=A0A2R9T2G2_9BACL|nr:hypothetical protein [Paenibacillus vortex]EFU43865.1 hypothetical protein PVOR_01600 [Paenibacillus vortex V453]
MLSNSNFWQKKKPEDALPQAFLTGSSRFVYIVSPNAIEGKLLLEKERSEIMNMMAFGNAERYILSLFPPDAMFRLGGFDYRVIFSGKPRPTNRGGECKTDVYVSAFNIQSGDEIELKISFKKENADFLENKMTDIRAIQIFGDAWQNRIREFVSQIHRKFLSRPIIYKSSYGNTQAGSFTLGWKMELVCRSNGDLSGNAHMTHDETIEVYAGNNLSTEKKDAIVHNRIIYGSGSANCVLNVDIAYIRTIQDAVDHLQGVFEYTEQNPDVYFVCKALNYRSFQQKWDGDRPLAVFVEWHAIDGRLTPRIIFNNPLQIGGHAVAGLLEESLQTLGIRDTDCININNVSDSRIIHF